jgi:hypothetical protein
MAWLPVAAFIASISIECRTRFDSSARSIASDIADRRRARSPRIATKYPDAIPKPTAAMVEATCNALIGWSEPTTPMTIAAALDVPHVTAIAACRRCVRDGIDLSTITSDPALSKPQSSHRSAG